MMVSVTKGCVQIYGFIVSIGSVYGTLRLKLLKLSC